MFTVWCIIKIKLCRDFDYISTQRFSSGNGFNPLLYLHECKILIASEKLKRVSSHTEILCTEQGKEIR